MLLSDGVNDWDYIQCTITYTSAHQHWDWMKIVVLDFPISLSLTYSINLQFFFAVHFFGWDACVVLQNMVMISGCICIWKAWHFDLNWVISCFLLRSLHAPDFPAIFKVWQVIVRPFSWAVTLLWTRKLILLLAKWNNALVNIVGVNCIQIGHVHKIHSRLFSASHECAQPLSCSD